MRFNRCIAGPVTCRFKANADRVIVCSSPLSDDGDGNLVPLDAKGGICPFFSPVEITDLEPEKVNP